MTGRNGFKGTIFRQQNSEDASSLGYASRTHGDNAVDLSMTSHCDCIFNAVTRCALRHAIICKRMPIAA
jgi:hypothetical protein